MKSHKSKFDLEYAKLYRRAMRYGKTPRGAKEWLDEHYTGNGRKAFKWQAFDSTPLMLAVTAQLASIFRDILNRT